jgi:hypothetical protein
MSVTGSCKCGNGISGSKKAGNFLTSCVTLKFLGTCSLTLREEHRLSMFENRVLRGIFGPKKEKVVGSCIREAS